MSASVWARRRIVAELRDLILTGYACNVQDWARVGVKKNVAECNARRREARRLIAVAIAAVERAR